MEVPVKTEIGATSYVFRYLLADAARAPLMADFFAMARNVGFAPLQVCENSRPLEAPPMEWKALRRHADDLGLKVTLGCMTLDSKIVSAYFDRMEAIGGRALRIVLDREHGFEENQW